MSPQSIHVSDRIESGRVVLHAHTQEFAGEVNAAVSESINELKAWMPWAVKPQTMEDTLLFCRESQADFLLRKAFHYRICLRDTGTVIGGCGAFKIQWDIPQCEIGYWCRTSHQRRGLMTEAIGALVETFINQLGFRRIEIRCDARNTRSRALAERLKFDLEGILRKGMVDNSGQPADACMYAKVR